MKQTYSTQLILSWPEFTALEDEWDELLVHTPADSIFLRWGWVDAWRQATNEVILPYIVLIRNHDSELVGIAPFYLSEYKLFSLKKYSVLRCLGDYPTGFEYPDLIIKPEHEIEIIKVVSRCLEQNRDWDAIWLPNISGWSGARQRIACMAKSLNSVGYERERDFSAISLPVSTDEYENQISPSHQYQLKRQSKRILEKYDVEISKCNTQEKLEDYIGSLFKLHALRWQSVGDEGTFNRKPVQAAFYTIFLPYALQNGWLRFYRLQLDSHTRAVQVGYIYRNVFHQLQEGFDPYVLPGIGNYLRLEVLDDCIQAGIKEYDFLGGFSEHKRRWGSQLRTGYDCFIVRKRLATLPLILRGFWPTGSLLNEITHRELPNKLTT